MNSQPPTRCSTWPGNDVAQISNLLYRRFPIGRLAKDRRAELFGRLQAGSTATQQIGNLRYGPRAFGHQGRTASAVTPALPNLGSSLVPLKQSKDANETFDRRNGSPLI